MNEAKGTGGKMPPAGSHKKKTRNSNEPRAAASREMESSLANPAKSPSKKRKPVCEPSAEGSAHTFEDAAAGASTELTMLVSTFAGMLSERAAADTCQMRELETLLKEAQNLESYLKEKKSHLRQTLALISDKLQG